MSSESHSRLPAEGAKRRKVAEFNQGGRGKPSRKRKHDSDGDGHDPPDPPGTDPDPDPDPDDPPSHPNMTPWALPTSGGSWNCNGLVNGQEGDKFVKATEVLRMLEKRDFTTLQETHSTTTRADPFQQWFQTRGKRCFWSHHNTKRAGVAVILNESFANKFETVTPTHIVKGNILRVRCTAASGMTLDIYSVYLPADSATLRRQMIRTLSGRMDKNAHSLITGDFNFTSGEGDRFAWERGNNSWQIEKDAENKTWEESFSGDQVVRELYQPCMTFQHTRFTSRIDRVYSSLDDSALHLLCPKAWVDSHVTLSDHKPLLFELKGEYGYRGNAPCLPKWTFRSKRFAPTVEKLFQKEDGQDPMGTPKEILNRLLWAMSTAAMQIAEDNPLDITLNSRDKFNTARRALVALRNGESNVLTRLNRVLPELDVQGKTWTPHEERRLLDIVKHWHRESVTEDVRIHQQRLNKGAASASCTDSAKAMKRLAPPGSKMASEYKCMYDPRCDSVVTTPKQIAEAVTAHWAQTFERRFVPDRAKVATWLRDFAPRLSTTDAAQWAPNELDFERAIEETSESATGPDGIPFEAFKQCKQRAAKVLCAITRDMMFNEHFEPNDHFNKAWLALLPKKPHMVDPVWGDVFSPGNLRPLSIVGCFNRIIASAMRYKLAAKLDDH